MGLPQGHKRAGGPGVCRLMQEDMFGFVPLAFNGNLCGKNSGPFPGIFSAIYQSYILI